MSSTKNGPVLLVDGDALVYRIAAATERETEWTPGEITLSTSLPEVYAGVASYLKGWMDFHGASGLRIAMSDAPWTFRMGVYKLYKAHRKDVRKPLGLAKVRQHMFDEHGATMLAGLEADDLMGLWMTDRYKANGIIVSWDKDMRAVPGRFWVPGTAAVEERNETEADLMWFAQALSGDAADGYPGCKNIGVVRAKRIVEDASEKYFKEVGLDLASVAQHTEVLWRTVRAEFVKKGQPEEEALINTRLARILRHGDYDMKEKKVRLWTPPGDRHSSSPSTVMLRERARAPRRGLSNASRGPKAWPSISYPSPSRSVVRRAKSSPRTGVKRSFGST